MLAISSLAYHLISGTSLQILQLPFPNTIFVESLDNLSFFFVWGLSLVAFAATPMILYAGVQNYVEARTPEHSES